MFFNYTRWILYGHFIACKAHHLAAQLHMHRVKRGLAEVFCRMISHGAL